MPSWLVCSHKDISFPMTRPRSATEGRRRKNTYVVCLECGKELPYSWSEMRVVKKERRRAQVAGEKRQPSDPAPAKLDTGTFPAKLVRSRPRES
jgi:hypothetical protein